MAGEQTLAQKTRFYLAEVDYSLDRLKEIGYLNMNQRSFLEKYLYKFEDALKAGDITFTSNDENKNVDSVPSSALIKADPSSLLSSSRWALPSTSNVNTAGNKKLARTEEEEALDLEVFMKRCSALNLSVKSPTSDIKGKTVVVKEPVQTPQGSPERKSQDSSTLNLTPRSGKRLFLDKPLKSIIESFIDPNDTSHQAERSLASYVAAHATRIESHDQETLYLQSEVAESSSSIQVEVPVKLCMPITSGEDELERLLPNVYVPAVEKQSQVLKSVPEEDESADLDAPGHNPDSERIGFGMHSAIQNDAVESIHYDDWNDLASPSLAQEPYTVFYDDGVAKKVEFTTPREMPRIVETSKPGSTENTKSCEDIITKINMKTPPRTFVLPIRSAEKPKRTPPRTFDLPIRSAEKYKQPLLSELTNISTRINEQDKRRVNHEDVFVEDIISENVNKGKQSVLESENLPIRQNKSRKPSDNLADNFDGDIIGRSSADDLPRGRNMLTKMGWRDGTGLGNRRDGMLTPLAHLVKLSKTSLEAPARTLTTKDYAWPLAEKKPHLSHGVKYNWDGAPDVEPLKQDALTGGTLRGRSTTPRSVHPAAKAIITQHIEVKTTGSENHSSTSLEKKHHSCAFGEGETEMTATTFNLPSTGTSGNVAVRNISLPDKTERELLDAAGKFRAMKESENTTGVLTSQPVTWNSEQTASVSENVNTFAALYPKPGPGVPKSLDRVHVSASFVVQSEPTSIISSMVKTLDTSMAIQSESIASQTIEDAKAQAPIVRLPENAVSEFDKNNAHHPIASVLETVGPESDNKDSADDSGVNASAAWFAPAW